MRLSISLQGICQAASYVYKKLVNDGILNQAFSVAPVSGIVPYFMSVTSELADFGSIKMQTYGADLQGWHS